MNGLTRKAGTCRIALLLCGLAPAVWVAGASDIPLTPALTLDAVDWQHCRAYAGETDLGPAPQEALAARLGLAPAGDAWSTGWRAEEFRRFTVCFRVPVIAGTLLLGGGVTQVAVLRDDAPYPGNPLDDGHWDVQAGGAVLTWPTPRALRALRITQRNSPVAWEPNNRPSSFPDLLLLRGRYASAVRLGGEEWRDAGKTREWIGHWVRGQRVAAIAVFGTPPPVAVRVLPDGVDPHPLQAPPPLWSALSPATVPGGDPRLVALSGSSAVLALALDAPLVAGKAPPPRVVPLVPLADGEAPPRMLPEMPVAVDYEMPMSGFAAVHITDAGGRHIRRLVAEVERARGPVREGWDLRGDSDRPVPPGTYHWTLLARPPLKLTYEGTVYNAGNPPWRAPVPGGGWWMADHSPPSAITAVGDRMVMASMPGGGEFGTELIITDPDGRKVWHDGQFGSHSGAARLVSDGSAAYAVNDDKVTRMIPGTNVARRVIHTFAYSDVLPGHAHSYIAGDRSGAAAKPGVLCVSYHAPEPPWIRSGLRAGDMDLKRSFPPVIQRKVHETALTPDEEVTSAFQIGVSSRSAGFGDAVTKGPLANTLVLALRRKVPIGSLVLPPGNVTVYALRAGKELPSTFDRTKGAEVTLERTSADAGLEDLMADFGGMDQRFPEDTWIQLSQGKGGSRPSVAVPADGVETAALAFSGPALKRLPYALALDRRYRDIAPEATLVALEGTATREGGWSISRASAAPVSAGSPAVAALVWAQPIEARGYLLTGPMAWAGLTVDVWSGAPDAVIDKAAVADPANWRRVQTHRQTRNHMKYNWHTPMTLLGDFGSSAPIRALRVSVNEHPVGPGASSQDVRGGFEGLVVFQSIGRDPELPRTLAERITVLNLPPATNASASATVRTHLPFDKPGALAFATNGDLFADTAQGVVRVVAVETQADPPVFTVAVPRSAYGRARALAVDADGLLYLLDAAARQIRVFDPTDGREVRRIGKPGGQLGPFDPESFSEPTAMTLDPRGKLWVVEQHFQPKRISRWSREGVFEKDFMGPTHYGGGGVMDPGDRSVINHLGMKFRMNWEDRSWKLESRLAPYSGNFYSPDRVVYAHGRRYLIGDRPVVTPFGDPGPISVICEEINGEAVPVVAAGILENWESYRKDRAMQQAFNQVKAATAPFVWSDRNRDRVAQIEEVSVIPNVGLRPGLHIGDDLSLNFLDGYRLRIASVLSNGVPVYDVAAFEHIPEIKSGVMVDASGRTFVMGHTFLDAAGKPLWRYPDAYASVQGSMKTPWGMNNRPPGVLSGAFSMLGNFAIGGEHLFCVGGNAGDYYAFTADGFLAAAILGGPRGYGQRYFSMADCRPGITDMSDLRKTVEDFHGSVTRAEDGRVYAIAGKNHVSILRVDGLEAMQRRKGVITVTADDTVRTARWIAERAAVERRRRQPGSTTVPYVSRALKIDGDILMDWPDGSAVIVFERRDDRDKDKVVEQVTARLAYDETRLYVAARATDASPMRNAATVPTMIFQQGDAFDLHLGLDPQADPARLDPAAGDVRLLFATLQGKDSAVLLRYVPGAAPLAGEPYTYTSPMGSVSVADAGVLKDARVVLRRDATSWVLEAAVPWAALGVAAPAKSFRLRGDLGVLMSDPDGISTVARHYWANRENVVLGDLPAEARVHPALWGNLNFVMPSDGDLLMDAMKEPPPSLGFPALK